MTLAKTCHSNNMIQDLKSNIATTKAF